MRPMKLQNKESRQQVRKKFRKRVMGFASVLMIISGILTILLSVLLLVFLGTAEMGHELSEQTGNAWIPYVCTGDFITALLGGIATLLEGGMAKRAATHPEMILPVWYISLLMVLMRVLDIVFSVLQRQAAAQTSTDYFNLLCSLVFFFIVESVRREAEAAGEDIY